MLNECDATTGMIESGGELRLDVTSGWREPIKSWNDAPALRRAAALLRAWRSGRGAPARAAGSETLHARRATTSDSRRMDQLERLVGATALAGLGLALTAAALAAAVWLASRGFLPLTAVAVLP